MFQKKVLGWFSLVLFVVSAAILAAVALLVFFPPLAQRLALNAQALILVGGVFALAATGCGFYAYKTAPGRVGAIGGLVLFIAIAGQLSFTTIKSRGSGLGAQPVHTYADQSLGFEFDYPATWMVDGPASAGERADSAQFTSWVHAPGDISADMPAGGTRFTATVWQWDPKNDLQAFVASRQAAWEASGFTFLSEERRDIGPGWTGMAFVIQTPEEQAYFFFTTIRDRYLSLSGSGNLSLLSEIGRTVRSVSP